MTREKEKLVQKIITQKGMFVTADNLKGYGFNASDINKDLLRPRTRADRKSG